MLVLLILGLFASGNSVKLIDQFSRQGSQLLIAARNGDNIRECSCEEKDICVGEIRHQVDQCFDECWNHAEKVSDNPSALKTCFKQKQYIIDDLTDCIDKNLETCVSDKNGKQIPYVNISKFLDKGESKIRKQIQGFMLTIGDSGKSILETALEIGKCIKECIQKKNSQGYCFDKKECQPLLDLKNASTSFRKCIREIHWKDEASDVCNCMVNSGMRQINQYCTMLKTINKDHS